MPGCFCLVCFPINHAADEVFYCSIHQYPAFPCNGYTMNVSLPPESGDDVFMDAINTCMHVLEHLKPDVNAISAGFEAHFTTCFCGFG